MKESANITQIKSTIAEINSATSELRTIREAKSRSVTLLNDIASEELRLVDEIQKLEGEHAVASTSGSDAEFEAFERLDDTRRQLAAVNRRAQAVRKSGLGHLDKQASNLSRQIIRLHTRAWELVRADLASKIPAELGDMLAELIACGGGWGPRGLNKTEAATLKTLVASRYGIPERYI